MDGQVVGYLAHDGKYFYKQSGEAIGYLAGKYIYAQNGSTIGYFDQNGKYIYSTSGETLGYLNDPLGPLG
jgi:hypothetical protein